MKIINLLTANGEHVSIEVSDDVFEAYTAMAKDERNNNHRESRRHVSLDKLTSLDSYLIKSTAPDPQDVVIQNFEKEQMQNYLGKLTEKQKQIMEMKYVDELSYAEIAARLNLDEGTIRGHARRAIKNILKNF